jgi:hypothetical protein
MLHDHRLSRWNVDDVNGISKTYPLECSVRPADTMAFESDGSAKSHQDRREHPSVRDAPSREGGHGRSFNEKVENDLVQSG